MVRRLLLPVVLTVTFLGTAGCSKKESAFCSSSRKVSDAVAHGKTGSELVALARTAEASAPASLRDEYEVVVQALSVSGGDLSGIDVNATNRAIAAIDSYLRKHC